MGNQWNSQLLLKCLQPFRKQLRSRLIQINATGQIFPIPIGSLGIEPAIELHVAEFDSDLVESSFYGSERVLIRKVGLLMVVIGRSVVRPIANFAERGVAVIRPTDLLIQVCHGVTPGVESPVNALLYDQQRLMLETGWKLSYLGVNPGNQALLGIPGRRSSHKMIGRRDHEGALVAIPKEPGTFGCIPRETGYRKHPAKSHVKR